MNAPHARILFVAANDWYFYWHRFALAERIAAAGYDVEVATPPGRFCDAISAAGMRHHTIQIDRQGLNPLNDIATIKRLADLYRNLEPTIVHHVAIKPIIYGTIAAKLAEGAGHRQRDAGHRISFCFRSKCLRALSGPD